MTGKASPEGSVCQRIHVRFSWRLLFLHPRLSQHPLFLSLVFSDSQSALKLTVICVLISTGWPSR